MKNISLLPVLCSAFLAMQAVQGATLSVSNATASASNTSYNLTSYGALDWEVWKKANGSNSAANAIATNSKAGGTALSDLFTVGATSAAGFRASTTSTPNWDFTYTDGTTAGPTDDANGVFHDTTGSAGKGVGLTVTLPTTGTYRITLFVAGYNTTTLLTASLAGATTVTNSSFTPLVSDPKNMAIFQIDATADSINDVLNLQIVNTALSNPTTSSTIPDSNGHVMISAVAVQLIPEPSSAVLALGSLAGCVLIRRRSKSA